MWKTPWLTAPLRLLHPPAAAPAELEPRGKAFASERERSARTANLRPLTRHLSRPACDGAKRGVRSPFLGSVETRLQRVRRQGRPAGGPRPPRWGNARSGTYEVVLGAALGPGAALCGLGLHLPEVHGVSARASGREHTREAGKVSTVVPRQDAAREDADESPLPPGDSAAFRDSHAPLDPAGSWQNPRAGGPPRSAGSRPRAATQAHRPPEKGQHQALF